MPSVSCCRSGWTRIWENSSDDIFYIMILNEFHGDYEDESESF